MTQKKSVDWFGVAFHIVWWSVALGGMALMWFATNNTIMAISAFGFAYLFTGFLIWFAISGMRANVITILVWYPALFFEKLRDLM